MQTRNQIRNTAASLVPHPNGTILVSYNTPVAAIIGGKGYVTNRKYSVTTSRHVREFVREGRGYDFEEKEPEFFNNLLREA